VNVDERVLRDLLQRVQRLERNQVRLRVGEVTDLAPLDVALGGADESYEDVSALGPVADGEQVAALVAGGNLLVLGRLLAGVGARFGGSNVTYPGGSSQSSAATVTHELGRTPTVVFTQSRGINYHARPASLGATTFTVATQTLDGTSPAAATSVDFYWLAL
jgi:hypothetical protein